MVADVNRKVASEESPGPIEQGCLITSSEGNLKESATENNRLFWGKGEKARQELTVRIVIFLAV